MSYENLSGSNLPAGMRTDADRQGPKGLPPSAFGKATQPAANTIQERPNYIILEATSDTAYNFLYETTCSLGGITRETHTQGYKFSAHGEKSSVKLYIQPVSWNGGGTTVGEITFVYRGGL